jgi:orotidine-5'-phosphate decarboxylase
LSSFGERLLETFSSKGNLCVGLDPSPEILKAWDLPVSVVGLRDFGNQVLDCLGEGVGIIKPQVAFYESFGSIGFSILEELLVRAKKEELFVIGDAKRGDIGSTMTGYYNAWLSETAPFVVDALTLSPYLGFGALEPIIEMAHKSGRGVFVLVATSNPEATEVQLAKTEYSSVAKSVFTYSEALNRKLAPGESIGPVGAVLGATLDLSKYGLDTKALTNVPILAPGFGSQGVLLSDSRAIYGKLAHQVVYNVSRSVLSVGAIDLAAAIESASIELAQSLSGDL